MKAMAYNSHYLNLAAQADGQKGQGVFSIDSRRFGCILDRSRVEALGLCLIALSLFDLLTTYVLLYNYFPDVYEANPVANWFFLRWNIFGMTLFKFALVASVILMSEIIERRRRGLGKGIMIFACIAASAVIFQGLHIYTGLAFGGVFES
jgi:hypothetical protein